MKALRSTHVMAVLVALGVCLANPLAFCAQILDAEKVHRVQAGYIYNFAKFAEWPDGTFADDEQPIVIGIVGADPILDLLNRVVRDKTVAGRAVEVRSLEWSRAEDREVARRCHVLYICFVERDRAVSIIKSVASSPVLTMSDVEGFAELGGMVGLVLSDNRIVFEINRKSVDRSGIKLSARLLQLARIVG